MKILAFVDTHGNRKALNEIIRKSEKADLLVCAGDLTNFGKDMNKLINILSKTGKILLIIPGNHEAIANIRALRQEFVIDIHKKLYEVDDVVFFGYGSGGFSLYDKGIERFLDEVKKNIRGKKFVLVTHAPPYGTFVDLIGIAHCGSLSITKFIVETNPVVNICGHLHENAGKSSRLNKTLIINPGQYGKLIEI